MIVPEDSLVCQLLSIGLSAGERPETPKLWIAQFDGAIVGVSIPMQLGETRDDLMVRRILCVFTKEYIPNNERFKVCWQYRVGSGLL